ncbi:hypothetical protein GAR05_03301 [Micromonospora saelicesensis]|uniref:Uncharacterized protein n=1 Tax=Micromonospora saelicesensis TaxID=285676 RepID=A0ABX9CH22_9ACTN|nr:hypothetical protein [Micromonospora saelicesensis]RAN97775.1 hypothetical protein GAR05_03301 [Micromonospora saelicesensis]
MSDSSLYSDRLDGETSENLWVLVGVLGTALAAAVWPTGGGPAVVAGLTALVEINIRTPDPWDKGSEAWNDMSDMFEQCKAGLTRARGDVDTYWADQGAEAFKAFLETRIEPALDAIAQAASNVRNMCDDMWWGLTTNLVSYISVTGAALVAAGVAYLSGPYTPAVQWAIVGAWAAFAITTLTAVLTFVQQVWTAGRDVGDAFSVLENMFTSDSDRIDTTSLQLPEQVRVRIAEPKGWVKE